MNFSEDLLSDAIDKYTDIERKIQRKNASQAEEIINIRTQEIINSYNYIISITKGIWNDNNITTEVRAVTKDKLVNIFNRTQQNITKLGTKVIYPPTFTEDLKHANQTDITNHDEILTQTKIPYDQEKFDELLSNFDTWDKKITRKNASQNEEKVQERTQEIVKAYNDLVKFLVPIIANNSEKSTTKLRDEVSARNDYVKDDLKLLNSDYTVPESITEKIKTENDYDDTIPTNNSNPSDNNKKENHLPTDDTKANTSDNKNGDNSKLDPKKTDIAPKQEKGLTMALTSSEYYKICNQQLNFTYSGDPIALPPLIDAIELLQFMDTQKAHEDILLRVIKTKLAGNAREILPENATIEIIKTTLKNKIKPENSKVVLGKMMALKADRTNLSDYIKKADDLSEMFKRSLILENVPQNKANEMTIDQTIELCRNNTRSQIVKLVLASTKFENAKEVLAKFTIETRTSNTEANQTQVLNFRKSTHNNFRGNFRRNVQRNFRENTHNNNRRYNQNNNNNYRRNDRGRSNFRGRQNNYRGNQNGNWRQNNFRGRQNNNHVYYTENSEAPPPGASHQQVEHRHAD